MEKFQLNKLNLLEIFQIMSFLPLGGFKDFPENQQPEDPHLGLEFDYEFAGERMGSQVSLLIHSWIIDYQGNIFSRKATYNLPRTEAITCIIRHIQKHLLAMGVDDMSCRRLMRDFEVKGEKAIAYERREFYNKAM